MPRFNFRENTSDKAIYCSIIHLNEYRLPQQFNSTDMIIDVGAHIGAFAYAAIRRGARYVYCIEADYENYLIACQHLAEFVQAGQITLQYGAVWRSDENQDILAYGGYEIRPTSINTGGGMINTQGYGKPTPKIPLDDLLLSVTQNGEQHIRLLKLDCEGSEWPILLTSQYLNLIDEIVGEFHEFGGQYDVRSPPFTLVDHQNFTVWLLIEHLSRSGFKVTYRRHWVFNERRQRVPEHLGLFSARRLLR